MGGLLRLGLVLGEAGGDDGDADLVLQGLVKGGTEDGDGIGMNGVLDQAGGLLHLLQADVHGAGDVDQDAVGAVDGRFQQRA